MVDDMTRNASTADGKGAIRCVQLRSDASLSINQR